MDMQFSRYSSRFVYQLFLPTAVLTLLSFASFWMKPKGCRIKFLLASLLLLYLHTVYFNGNGWPKALYTTTNKDYWLSSCTLFVIAAIAEFVVVKLLGNLIGKKTNDKLSNGTDDLQKSLTGEGSTQDKTVLERIKGLSVTQIIDLTSAIIFPLAFTIFVIYFSNTIKPYYEL